MTGWLVDPTNNIEIEFASFIQIDPISSCVINRYSSMLDGVPRIIPGDAQPFEFSITAEITDTTTIDAAWRKLNYFEKNKIPVLLLMPSEGKALEGYIENISNPIRADRQNIISISFKFIAGGIVMGYCKAAAELTTTGTLETDTDANNDQAILLNATQEYAYFSVTQSAWALPGIEPQGAAYNTYRIYARAKDASPVASDFKVIFQNHTDADVARATTTTTVTASYAWYYVEYTLVAGDNTDVIYALVKKATGSAANIYVDMVVLVQHYIA